MVGPPSSWSEWDQEDATWEAARRLVRTLTLRQDSLTATALTGVLTRAFGESRTVCGGRSTA